MGFLTTWITMIGQALTINAARQMFNNRSRVIYICVAGGAILAALIITRR